jgi:hypothetical protein
MNTTAFEEAETSCGDEEAKSVTPFKRTDSPAGLNELTYDASTSCANRSQKKNPNQNDFTWYLRVSKITFFSLMEYSLSGMV